MLKESHLSIAAMAAPGLCLRAGQKGRTGDGVVHEVVMSVPPEQVRGRLQQPLGIQDEWQASMGHPRVPQCGTGRLAHCRREARVPVLHSQPGM